MESRDVACDAGTNQTVRPAVATGSTRDPGHDPTSGRAATLVRPSIPMMLMGALMVLLMVCQLAGCGGGGNASTDGVPSAPPADAGGALPERGGGFTTGAQAPPPGGTSPQPAVSDLPPVPTDAVPVGDATVAGATTTQSYRVEGSTPDQLINSYEDLATADGWEPSGRPMQIGANAWQLELVRDGADLVVTTDLATGGTGSGQDTVELSLQLTAA